MQPPPPRDYFPPYLKLIGCHPRLALPSFRLSFFETLENACALLQALFAFSVHAKYYYESP